MYSLVNKLSYIFSIILERFKAALFSIMSRFWKNPPKDKLEVRKKEEKYNHLRKAKDYKDNAQLLHRFDNSYRTKFDVSKPYQMYTVVKDYMKTFKIYKSLEYLINNKFFNIDYIGNRRIIPNEDVLDEIFRREMCVFRDWIIWENDKKRERAKQIKRKEKKNSKRFFININNRRIWFGTYPLNRFNLAKDVAAFLLKNDYIFDKSSQYYLKDAELRKIVRQKMHSRSFEKMDLKSYILKIKQKGQKS